MMRKTITALLLAGSVLTAGCDPAVEEQAKTNDILLRAQSYFDQGQYSAASIEARNALREDAHSLDAQLLIARIYFQQGNYTQSIKTLEELPQDNVEVVELLGNNYLRQAKYKSLRQLLQTHLQKPNAETSWELNRLQAIALVQQGQTAQALKQIDSLAASATTQEQKATAEVVRSYFHSQNKDKDKQLQALDQALTYSPGYVDALVEKAKIQYGREDYEAAEDLLSQALISLPRTDVMTLKRLEVLQAMASTLSRQNRSGEAMIYSKLIAEANPRAQELQNEFDDGIEKLKAGDIKSAEEIFSKLYISDHAKMAGSVLGLIKFQRGEYKEAAEFFESTIDPETASPELLRAFAESQLRMRNPEQALRTIESSLMDDPTDPDILSVYGLALLSTGNTDKGIETINKALELAPERGNLRLALANAYNAKGEPERSLQETEKAYRANRTDVAIQERLAMQYAMMGKMAELTTFARELSKAPSVESQALAGLILLRTEPQSGARLLDELYAKSPSEPAVLRAQLRKNIQAQDFNQVVRIGKLLVKDDANDIATLGAITQAYLRLDQRAEAIRYLNQLSDESANIWGADYILAAQAFAEQDYGKATEHVNKAVAKSAYNPVSTRLYSQIYLSNASRLAGTQDYTSAREVILEAMQNNEVSPPLLHLLIRVELADDNLSEAEKVAAELQQAAPGSQITNHAQGDIAAAKGDNTAALTHYKSAWTLKPSDAVAADIWKQLSSGSASEQTTFLEEWQQKLPNSFVVKNIIGLRHQETGRKAAATKAYQESLSLNPGQPVILNNIAWLLMEDNRLTDAYAHAERAVAMAGNNAAILDTFGWIAFKSGRKDVALAHLEKALQLQPDNSEIKAHLDAVKAK